MNSISKKIAVIFVPGLMGTELKRDSDNLQLWPVKTRAKLQKLALDENGNDYPENKASPSIVIKTIDVGINNYKKFFDNMNSLGNYEENIDLFSVPYDWRKDLEGESVRIKEKIDESLDKGNTEIAIVAHSMGGLLVRSFLSKFPSYFSLIDKIFFCGTPHLGAPVALDMIYNGTNLPQIFWHDKNRISFITTNMPSIYQLMPSSKYKHQNQNDFFYHNDNLRNDNTHHVTVKGINQSMINKAKVFHDSLDNNWDKFRWANKAFFMASQSRNTITSIEPDKNSDKQIKLIYKYGKGDGRVPITSASPDFLIYNKTKQVFYFDERHDQLLSNQLVVQKILDLIDSSNASSV